MVISLFVYWEEAGFLKVLLFYNSWIVKKIINVSCIIGRLDLNYSRKIVWFFFYEILRI